MLWIVAIDLICMITCTSQPVVDVFAPDLFCMPVGLASKMIQHAFVMVCWLMFGRGPVGVRHDIRIGVAEDTCKNVLTANLLEMAKGMRKCCIESVKLYTKYLPRKSKIRSKWTCVYTVASLDMKIRQNSMCSVPDGGVVHLDGKAQPRVNVVACWV